MVREALVEVDAGTLGDFARLLVHPELRVDLEERVANLAGVFADPHAPCPTRV